MAATRDFEYPRRQLPLTMRAATVWALALVLAGAAATSVRSQEAASPVRSVVNDPAAHGRTIDAYCVTCHSERLKSGGLNLESLDLLHLAAAAETWEAVIRKLRLGVMPPPGARRPERAALDGLASWLEDTLDRQPCRAPIPAGRRCTG